MAYTLKNWKENVYNSLYDIADLEYQKILWKGLDSRYIFSFSEAISGLYDDCNFEEFIGDNWNNLELSDNLHSHLKDFDKLLSQYIKNIVKEKQENNHVSRDDEDILYDPQWINISNIAKQIIKKWNQEEKIELQRSDDYPRVDETW